MPICLSVSFDRFLSRSYSAIELIEEGLDCDFLHKNDIPLHFVWKTVFGGATAQVIIHRLILMGLDYGHLKRKEFLDPSAIRRLLGDSCPGLVYIISCALVASKGIQRYIGWQDMIEFQWTFEDLLSLGIDFNYLLHCGSLHSQYALQTFSRNMAMDTSHWNQLGMTEENVVFLRQE